MVTIGHANENKESAYDARRSLGIGLIVVGSRTLHVTDQSKYKLSPDLTNDQSTNKRDPNFNIFV